MSTANLHPVATVCVVTPEIAARWLDRNKVNRALRPDAIDRYARDMKAGAWKMTGEAIKFDIDGNVLDGQHRLWAILTSETPVELLVVNGLAPETQLVMDSGSKRSAADALGFLGHTTTAQLAAAARIAIAYERGVISSAIRGPLPALSNTEIADFVTANPDLVEAMEHRNSSINRTALSFAKWVLRRIDAQEADEFIDDIVTMRTAGSGDPRATLLRRIQASRENREALNSVAQAHLMFRTWNAIRSGEKLDRLQMTSRGGAITFARPK